RAPIKAEIEGNPALKKEVAGMMTMEHESDPVAVMESLANRTDYINTERAKQGKPPLSVNQMLHGGFYGPAAQFANRARQLEGQPNRLKRMYDAMDAVWAGSNLLFGATDQGSGSDPNVGWQGDKIVRFGETYNDWGGGPGGHEGARRYREMIQKGFREGVKRGVWAGNAGAVPFLDGSQWGQPAFADRFGDWTKRNKIDEALRTASGRSGNLGTAKVDIEFTGNKSKDDV